MFYRPASWRMPTRKQMEAMARAVDRNAPPGRSLGPGDDLPSGYWESILEDAGADGSLPGPAPSGRLLRLDQIPQHLLRAACRRCNGTIEIQKADAVRLYGPDAIWRDVGHRLLDNTCTIRTGRHEEDGCWPTFE